VTIITGWIFPLGWQAYLFSQRNHPVLHLITDKSEALYSGWGWQTIERRQQYGGDVVVMEKRL
jgi:hypothetical protein